MCTAPPRWQPLSSWTASGSRRLLRLLALCLLLGECGSLGSMSSFSSVSVGPYLSESFDSSSSSQGWHSSRVGDNSAEPLSQQPRRSTSATDRLGRVQAELKRVFGYSELRGKQEAVILSLLQGRDAFAVMPTGAGKSMCYQLPGVMAKEKVTVVVTPLLALMLDQVATLNSRGIPAGALYSSQGKKNRDKIMNDLFGRLGDGAVEGPPLIRLLYVTPELLCNSAFQTELLRLHGTNHINMFAIDEAHCISEWGHEFRPSFRKLGMIHKHFCNVPWLALTATASLKVRKDVAANLGLDIDEPIVQSFDRPNIRYQIRHKNLIGDDNAVHQDLLSFLAERPKSCTGIIYCHTQAQCEELASRLALSGIRSRPYHAGMKAKERQETYREWMAGSTKVVVATVAFGMGIDKADVRFVVHMTMPKSLESYYQETGRAGRDAKDSEALMYFSQTDAETFKYLLRWSNQKAHEAGNTVDETRMEAQQDALDRVTKFCGGNHRNTNGRGGSGSAMSFLKRHIWRKKRALNHPDVMDDIQGGWECRRVQLLRHFGEDIEAGGTRGDLSRCCDFCNNPDFVKRADFQMMEEAERMESKAFVDRDFMDDEEDADDPHRRSSPDPRNGDYYKDAIGGGGRTSKEKMAQLSEAFGWEAEETTAAGSKEAEPVPEEAQVEMQDEEEESRKVEAPERQSPRRPMGPLDKMFQAIQCDAPAAPPPPADFDDAPERAKGVGSREAPHSAGQDGAQLGEPARWPSHGVADAPGEAHDAFERSGFVAASSLHSKGSGDLPHGEGRGAPLSQPVLSSSQGAGHAPSGEHDALERSGFVAASSLRPEPRGAQPGARDAAIVGGSAGVGRGRRASADAREDGGRAGKKEAKWASREEKEGGKKQKKAAGPQGQGTQTFLTAWLKTP